MPIARSLQYKCRDIAVPPPPPPAPSPPPPPPGTPNWYANQASGTWGTLPGGTLAASGVMQSGADSILTAWGGGIINSTGLYVGSTFLSGTFLVIWGGGHGDYSGNEYYAFGPFESDTPQWYRPRDRTVPAPNNVSEDGSGNPVSRHTYGSLVYIPGSNRMITVGGGGRYSDANDSNLIHILDFNQPNPNSSQPWSKASASPPTTMWMAGYDPGLDTIFGNYVAGNSLIASYGVSSNTANSYIFKSPNNHTSGSSCAMDYNRHIIAFYSSQDGMQFFDCRNPSANDYYTPTTIGTGPTNGSSGMCYDPVADRFVMWRNNGKELWFLTPPTTSPYQGGNAWTWSSVNPSTGATPSAALTNGTYGRFAYSPNSTVRGYSLLNSSSGSIYFYKP